MNGLYDEYGGYFYVPMTQAFSLAVPVTVGCSWDKCSYCDLNHNNSFRILSQAEIQRSLEKLQSQAALGTEGSEKSFWQEAIPSVWTI